jgi:DNA mismatch repair protein MutS
MMRQYVQAKAEYPDCILFFRLGDFYEMFFEDAEIASKILDIALTSRTKGEDSYPMCGIPHFSANGYIAKLVEDGHKVAVCDQVEDAKQAKGIVKRKVTRVVSPGMITNPEDLDARESNFLGGIALDEEHPGGPVGFSILDVSTADYRATQVPSADALMDEIARVRPRELLLPVWFEGSDLHEQMEKRFADLFLRFVAPDEVQARMPDLDDAALSGRDMGLALKAAKLVFSYVNASLPGTLEHVRRLVPYQVADHMIVDEYSRANLELVRTSMEGRRKGSLLDVLDCTCTPMGARMLAQWMLYPLVDPEKINERLDAVEQLLQDAVLRSDLKMHLSGVRDMERLLAKVSVGQATPRDLGSLRDSLQALPDWAVLVTSGAGKPLAGMIGTVDLLEDVSGSLQETLVDEPPADLSDGGAVRPGCNAELDRFVELAIGGRKFIAELEQKEKKQTGIASLKIRYNRVFGYYLEVTKPNIHLVPEHYRRKQTTANAERYETDELNRQAEAIFRAQADRVALEHKIISKLMDRVRACAARILDMAQKIATSDVLASLAEVAGSFSYCRPQVDDGEIIDVSDGRHPVVEQALGGERFVPNDVHLRCSQDQILIITGPNMAGKSTVIRQVALIAILSQMGSYVPAAAARIGIVDRIFTRIGAADNLARGQSTFMVEMNETAHILENATRRSLIVLDEVGRGTSTFDGLSIAWAVAEYLHDRVGARTLFATHYHQLTDLALTKERVTNYTIQVREWKDNIVFLRRMVRGICNRSYGIQVGKLAGLPGEVVGRAREILANLEGQEYDEVGSPRLSRMPQLPQSDQSAAGQLQLFSPPTRSVIEEELDKLDLENITPIEALQILNRFKGEQ